MILFRKLLFPLALLYGLVTAIRNFSYRVGLLKSYSFDFPVIAVGNLSVGGTGKTPLIEYLIRFFQEDFRVATLSRGYKRASRGFHLANSASTVLDLGDESFQYFTKFPKVQVAVDANRVRGILQLKMPEIVLLDDAFQHRRVKAGMYILTTAYDDLYVSDWMLPTGNLREFSSGANRAAVVVVTKCPPALSLEEQLQIQSKLRLQPYQKLFFTSIAYSEFVYSEHTQRPVQEIKKQSKLLVTGIAKPQFFYDFLRQESDEFLTFPDHHHFTQADIKLIQEKANHKMIVTTEKDYMRLKGKIDKDQLYYLPIQCVFVNNELEFKKALVAYVGQSRRNRKFS